MMTREQAIELARNIKFSALEVKSSDPAPDALEAIELIKERWKDLGFNWLTGQAAIEVLQKPSP